MIAIHQAIIDGKYCSYLRQRAAERQAISALRAQSKLLEALGDMKSGRHKATMDEIARRLYQRYHPFSYGISWETR